MLVRSSGFLCVFVRFSAFLYILVHNVAASHAQSLRLCISRRLFKISSLNGQQGGHKRPPVSLRKVPRFYKIYAGEVCVTGTSL